jgi:two-component system, chemotaxis family, response regulator Rcp1
MTAQVSILLVDDSPDDVELTLMALERTQFANNVSVVSDGVYAMQYLKQEGQYKDAQKPALVMLDLNMPRKNGQQVLAEMKANENLRQIPVVILTTSQAEEDIVRSYDLGANCYVTKPVDLEQLIQVVQAINQFWFGIVKLPTDK